MDVDRIIANLLDVFEDELSIKMSILMILDANGLLKEWKNE